MGSVPIFFHVQAALLRLGLLPPPAAGADVFAGLHRARARRAADRAVTLVVEPVVGNAVLAEVMPDLGLAPGGERVEFLDAVRRVELALGELGASRRVLAALSRDPGALSGERPPERLDLADLAAALAQLDTSVESVAAVEAHVLDDRPGIRLVNGHIVSITGFYLPNQIQGVGVQAAGVEHEDPDRQAGARDGVGEDHVFGRETACKGGRRELRGDAPQSCQEGIDLHPERRRKRGTGCATEAW